MSQIKQDRLAVGDIRSGNLLRDRQVPSERGSRSAGRTPDRVALTFADRSELIGHARGSLAPFKVPKRVHFVAELPRNQSGKLLKRVLRDQL